LGNPFWENFFNEHFGGAVEGSSTRRTPKFGQNNCITNKSLHCEFQLSMFSSSKVSFNWGHFGSIHL